jgi:hypothetical protein
VSTKEDENGVLKYIVVKSGESRFQFISFSQKEGGLPFIREWKDLYLEVKEGNPEFQIAAGR